MITEQQRQNRSKGIGGSDMAIILGLSTYMTPYELYLEKIGEGKEREETEQQYWGNKLEPVIVEEFKKRNGFKVIEQDTITHPIYDFMIGHTDGFIPEQNAVLEVKCSSSFMRSEWGDDGSDVIPMQYLVQVAHYCAITNADCAYIVVLIGGNEYRQFKYIRDIELEMKLIDAAKKFWKCVTTRTPPEASTISDLKLIYPEHVPEKAIIMSDEINNYITEMKIVKSKIKEHEEVEEKCKFNIMSFMGDAEVLTYHDGQQLCTWKANKRGTRTFLLKGI